MTSRFWLYCTRCAVTYHFEQFLPKCLCGGSILVKYDMERISNEIKVDGFLKNVCSLWRYSRLLPIQDEKQIITLGEGRTPLIPMSGLAKLFGVKGVFVKREEQNPTGSFKARGITVAISLLKAQGVKKVAIPSNGNAATAVAAYSAKARMDSYVFLPKDCPKLILEECKLYGAHVFLVDGLIHDASKIIEDGKFEQGWFNIGTMQEPGRIEGKKTMGFELAEDFNWELPDVVIYPTGGGSGIIGMWKAFNELKQLGLVKGELPRLVSVQEYGCQPIVNAVRELKDLSSHQTGPTGMRVPLPPDIDLIKSILRETQGTAITVEQDNINQGQKLFGMHGISSSPEGSATMAALFQLKEMGYFRPEDRIVLFNTSHAIKYIHNSSNSNYTIIKDYLSFQKQSNLFVG